MPTEQHAMTERVCRCSQHRAEVAQKTARVSTDTEYILVESHDIHTEISTSCAAMIVEVACVRLESTDLSREPKVSLHEAPYEKRQASLRFTLTRGIRMLSRVSKSSFQLLEDTEDPSLVYYIGRWRSLAEYTGFRASAERKELITALRFCEASLDWHEISEAKYSHPRNLAFLHRPTDIFSSPLVGIARCHAGNGWKTGGGAEVEWVLSSTRRHPIHRSLIGTVPLMVFGKDVMISSSAEESDEVDHRSRTVIGEWKTGEQMDVWGGSGCQVRCSSVDLRIASPVHLR